MRYLKQLVILISVFCVCGSAVADVIYQEIFTADNANEIAFNATTGRWYSFEGATGAIWQYPKFSYNGGAALDGGSVNSYPVFPDNPVDPYDDGYLYVYAYAGRASFMFTDEYSFIPVSDLHFSMRHNCDRANAEPVRAALKIDGQWYVSEAVIIGDGGWSASGMWHVQANDVDWYSLTFSPGVVMSIGGQAALPATGTVTAHGWYVDAYSSARSLRFDNYRIEGQAVEPPVPPSGGLRFSLELLETRKIWDHSDYDGFTDLVRFNGQWFCSFREADSHMLDGKLRVIRSTDDGETWTSAALLVYPLPGGYTEIDMREGHFSITPDGQLMINAVVTLINGTARSSASISYLSSDGINWSDAYLLSEPGQRWLWRAEWHDATAYSFAYAGDWIRLYASTTGTSFDPVGPAYFHDDGSNPNETGMVFDGDTLWALARREGPPYTAQLGHASPPYDNFTWQDMGLQIHSPDIIMMPNGQMLAGIRRYDLSRTSLCWVDPVSSTMPELVILPGGGRWHDLGYPGLVLHDNQLWVSYYSTPGEKPCIYFSKLGYTLETPYGGTAWEVPGTIEAEDYDEGGGNLAYYDCTSGNSGGQYRTDDVDIDVCSEGGYHVGDTVAGEWLKYTIDVAHDGWYDINVRSATTQSGKTLHFKCESNDITGAVAVPNTGGWQTVTAEHVYLSQGEHILSLVMDTGNINVNWISLVPSPASTWCFYLMAH